MIPILAMLAALSAQASGPNRMDAVPSVQGTLEAGQLPIPVSDSVRAATWDSLSNKPEKPVRLRVACIVIAYYGVPGACVLADRVASDAKTIDWVKVRNDFDQWTRTANPAEVELLYVVGQRLSTARAPERRGPNGMFEIRYFEEVVTPDDARAPFAAGSALTLNEVKLTQPIDASLLSRLYPTLALRKNVSARVTMACDIQPNLKLLCRDPGQVYLAPQDGMGDQQRMTVDFRLATYQFLSTLQLEPKSLKGESVTGHQLKLALVWKVPD